MPYVQIGKHSLCFYHIHVRFGQPLDLTVPFTRPRSEPMKSVDYVASEERKRRVVMICSSWPPTEKPKRKRSLVCGVAKKPIGNNVATTKKRVIKRMSKNDSVLHKVCPSCNRN